MEARGQGFGHLLGKKKCSSAGSRQVMELKASGAGSCKC